MAHVLQVRHGQRHRVVRLEDGGQRADQRLLRTGELVFGGSRLCKADEFLLVLRQRVGRILADDAAGGHELTGVFPQIEIGADAVAVAVGLAEIHVQAAGEEAAQDIVAQPKGDGVGMSRGK